MQQIVGKAVEIVYDRDGRQCCFFYRRLISYDSMFSDWFSLFLHFLTCIAYGSAQDYARCIALFNAVLALHCKQPDHFVIPPHQNPSFLPNMGFGP